MSNKEVNSVSDIITRIFHNIDVNQMESAVQISAVWKETLCSIQNQSSDNYGVKNNLGRKLADHTNIVDLKNEILIVETDHSGWIQTLQLYNSYILKGLKKKFPDLTIKSIAYRLKGSFVQLKNDTTSDKKEALTIEEKKVLEQSETKHDLPDEFKLKFEQLKKSMLDKS